MGRPVDNGRYVGSLVAAIGDIIERHMIDTGFLAPAETLLVAKASDQPSAATSATRIGPLCPKCNQPGLVREAGSAAARAGIAAVQDSTATQAATASMNLSFVGFFTSGSPCIVLL